jgi:hypothetical protein
MLQPRGHKRRGSFGVSEVYFFPDLFLPDDFLEETFLWAMGLPQHQMVCSEIPQASTMTSLPQGTHTSREPFLTLAITHLLAFIF